LLEELTKRHEDLGETVQGISTAGVEQLQGVEARMGDMHEALQADIMAVSSPECARGSAS